MNFEKIFFKTGIRDKAPSLLLNSNSESQSCKGRDESLITEESSLQARNFFQQGNDQSIQDPWVKVTFATSYFEGTSFIVSRKVETMISSRLFSEVGFWYLLLVAQYSSTWPTVTSLLDLLLLLATARFKIRS